MDHIGWIIQCWYTYKGISQGPLFGNDGVPTDPRTWNLPRVAG